MSIIGHNYYHFWKATTLTFDLDLSERHNTYIHQHDRSSNYYHLLKGSALTTTNMIGTQTTIICGKAQHSHPPTWYELKQLPSLERLSTYNHQHGTNSNYYHLWKGSTLTITSMVGTKNTIIYEMAQHLYLSTWEHIPQSHQKGSQS